MGTRQLTVMCCDWCAVEVLDDQGQKETRGWLYQSQSGDQYGLHIRHRPYGKAAIPQGHWCSIECYCKHVEKVYTQAEANVKPYIATH